ncbi:hypothetical protein Q7C36_019436 [Tachysurus vachellii]|uniref:Immunoglobulin V-set domain-containing protein n=1 Tax=Tachysurus vachellii TaxID=175792 RepID=A0AA88S0B5_TACVA|nr:hypothetical protein Q7C36_019436 [Tachysurus vachellii]
MMKTILIFTLSLISGQLNEWDGPKAVNVFPGQNISIISNYPVVYNRDYKYIMKLENGSVSNAVLDTFNEPQNNRFSISDDSRAKVLGMNISHVTEADDVVYFYGIYNRKNSIQYFSFFMESRLHVRAKAPIEISTKTTDFNSCCDRPKTVNVFPGQNISINSNYPVIYNQAFKYIMKLENGSDFYDILDTSENSQNNRFSISDDSSAKVLSMSISHVTEADNGVYLYGIFNRKKSIQYFSFFREIHLNVRESLVNTTIIIIIISVCVLLIGGFTLLVIYKLRHKGTQGSRPSSQDNEHAPSVHENNLPNLPTYENLKIKMRSNDQNLDSSTSQSDSTYQTLDPRTNQSDSNYMSLSNTTDQSHSHYQCLNARTQVNSVYQTLHS